MFRIGLGYDAHRLVEKRPLILGGVEIPFHMGLEGHSDADVLTHAVIDAVIGAMGLGDIGQHFPDSDPAYAGIASLSMLRAVTKMMKRERYRINNVDATIVAEKPKLEPHLENMRKKIAENLEAPMALISIKATTTEGLGFSGRQEGIAAFAAVTIVSAASETMPGRG
jgi:2-C-methyl-D-erythritol 2,4-cyclodiphosphate synthase